jgi:hypothetical protein
MTEALTSLKMPKKRVSFDKIASIVLIPTKQEFRAAGLGDHLWWNDSDYHSFKVSAAEDVREHIRSVNFAVSGISAVKSYLQTFLEPDDLLNTQENVVLMSQSLYKNFYSAQQDICKPKDDEELSTISTATASSENEEEEDQGECEDRESSLITESKVVDEEETSSNQLALFVRMLAFGVMVILNRHGPSNPSNSYIRRSPY